MSNRLKVTPNDLSAFWMPFTANRQFKQAPRMFVSAKDMHYTTSDGRKVLDGTAGPVVRQCRPLPPEDHRGDPAAGGRARLRAGLPDGPSRSSSSSPTGWSTSRPKGIDHVFFTNSGSESVDTALKIALAYHRVKGEGARFRLIGRERGYHGVNFGGISVGGIVTNRKMFGTLLDRRRPYAAHASAWRRTPSPAASRSMARSSPTSWSASSRCTTPRPSPRSSSSRSPARPAC